MGITQPGSAGHLALGCLLAFAAFTASAAEPSVSRLQEVTSRNTSLSAGGIEAAVNDDAAPSTAVVAGAYAGNSVRRTVEVHYLVRRANSKAGATRLYERLKSAARRACGTASGRALAEISDFNRCRVDALSAAIADVGSRTLTALHRSRASALELARFEDMLKNR